MNTAFYKPNGTRGYFLHISVRFWCGYFVLCVKVLYSTLYFLILIYSTLWKLESSLSRTFLDLYNHGIFKTWGEILTSLSLALLMLLMRKPESRDQSGFAQSHVSSEWQCSFRTELLFPGSQFNLLCGLSNTGSNPLTGNRLVSSSGVLMAHQFLTVLWYTQLQISGKRA